MITKKFKANDLQERRTIEKCDNSEDVSECSTKTQPRKGKKYHVFTDEEKTNILDYVKNFFEFCVANVKKLKEHGMKKTIETFSTEKHRLTQRKLRFWTESQVKVKERKF